MREDRRRRDGLFHPHGDQAIYDALVRLAQDFAQRYPLIEGRATSVISTAITLPPCRYTESRMTEVARLLLEGIEEDAVDFRDELRRRPEGAGRSAGGFPEPSRQRRARHRRRHGDVDPAA